MDREILFRGKRIYDNMWIYGNLVVDKSGYPHIVEQGFFHEDGHHLVYDDDTDKPVFFFEKSIGQYTGFKDRNGKRIFEGDIIKARQAFCGELLCRGVVEYRNLRWEVPEDDFVVEESSLIEYEVIGNIHDNPEMVEV